MKFDKSQQLSYVFDLPKHNFELDFLDLDLSTDLQMYVDPILLYRSTLKDFNAAHSFIVEFFRIAIAYVKESKQTRARQMCQFPDAENLLGIAETGPGHGPRKELGRRIYEELVNNKEIQEHGLIFLNEFQLLIYGISFDLVSDAAVQISKDVFIKYTQDQCALFGIPTKPSIIRYFDWEEKEWESKETTLPRNPLKNDSAFIFTPRTVVRRYPQGNYIEFYNEIYKYVLFEKGKETLWKGLSKEPKAPFTEIAEKYKNKTKVVEYIRENPKSKIEFFEKIKPKEETAWLDQLALSWGVNVNQVLDLKTLESLRKVLKSPSEIKTVNQAVEAVEKQLKLKRPKKKLVPQIERLVVEAKQKTVLLLGNYTHANGQKRLEEIKEYLGANYEVIVMNSVNLPPESIEESVLRMATLARFVIVEDSYAGGQQFEISSLKGKGFITAIMRQRGVQASFMSRGVSGIQNSCKEFDYELIPSNGIEPKYVRDVVSWAEEQHSQKIKYWKDQYPWKN